MANPTTLTRPKVIGVSTSGMAGGQGFTAKLYNSSGELRETIYVDKTGNRNTLRLSQGGKAAVDMSWFNTWTAGDKLVVSFTGKVFGSGSVVLTSASSGKQSISQITGISTTMPGVDM